MRRCVSLLEVNRDYNRNAVLNNKNSRKQKKKIDERLVFFLSGKII
jgi:hypothetical protein